MRLYRFRTSPYVHKVEAVLDLLGHAYERVDVGYCERDELATLTGGYVYVPVLVTDDGAVICDSRVICQHLLQGEAGARLVPPPWEGPVWAYADFAEGALEDVLFRIGCSALRDAWGRPGERALFTLVKERKFGAGCIEAWDRARPELLARAEALLAPTVRTLAARPFLFGAAPTLADAALYGQCMMLETARAGALAEVAPALVAFTHRMEAARRAA